MYGNSLGIDIVEVPAQRHRGRVKQPDEFDNVTLRCKYAREFDRHEAAKRAAKHADRLAALRSQTDRLNNVRHQIIEANGSQGRWVDRRIVKSLDFGSGRQRLSKSHDRDIAAA